jgi:hypothetical protein
MTTLQFGKSLASLGQAYNVDMTDLHIDKWVSPDGETTAVLSDFDPVSATMTMQLTKYGQSLFKRIVKRGFVTCAQFDQPMTDALRELGPGATATFGDKTYKIYRRDWKRNKVWMQEVQS